MKRPILSLCIPVYNRIHYLDMNLAQLFKDKELFDNDIQLLISDNCSTDDILSCIDKYRKEGLRIDYNRNQVNIGPDLNFIYCYKHAIGKYVWLLGVDDIINDGILKIIYNILRNKDYGLLHIRHNYYKDNELIEYSNKQFFLKKINYWITFISGNIIQTKFVKNFNFEKYKGTYQMYDPVYLEACLNSELNAIYGHNKLFKEENDGKNNGGYNLFKVFIEEYLSIYKDYISDGKISNETFNYIKKITYKEFISTCIINHLLFKRKSNFDLTHAWKYIFSAYGKELYAYFYLIRNLITYTLKKMFHKIK